MKAAAGSDGDVSSKHLLLKQNKTLNYINLYTADNILIWFTVKEKLKIFTFEKLRLQFCTVLGY